MLTGVSQTRAVKSVWLASLAMALAFPAGAQSPSTPSPEYQIGCGLFH